MQRVQNQLDFKIETPSDEELAKRFRENQEEISKLISEKSMTPIKHKKRQSKNAKKLAKTNKKFKKYKKAEVTA